MPALGPNSRTEFGLSGRVARRNTLLWVWHKCHNGRTKEISNTDNLIESISGISPSWQWRPDARFVARLSMGGDGEGQRHNPCSFGRGGWGDLPALPVVPTGSIPCHLMRITQAPITHRLFFHHFHCLSRFCHPVSLDGHFFHLWTGVPILHVVVCSEINSFFLSPAAPRLVKVAAEGSEVRPVS